MHRVGQTLIIYILANQKQLSESQICPPSQVTHGDRTYIQHTEILNSTGPQLHTL